MEDAMIWEFLEKHGHYGLKKNIPRHMVSFIFQFYLSFLLVFQLPVKSSRRGHRSVPMKHNEHVKDQLIDYSNPTAVKK